MRTLLSRLRFAWQLKKLARENTAEGKPLSIMDDLVFKAMLTSDNDDSREALRSLLSACIRREVSTVRVANNDLIPAHLGAKASRLDVHVTFNDGEAADLEMQVGDSGDDLKTRAAVYNAMLLSGNTRRGRPYKETKRVYQIFFLNGVLSPAGDRLPRRYAYLELEEHDRMTDVTEIIFYEMPKLEKRVRALLSGKADIGSLREDEKWCIFMKYRHDRRASPLIEQLCREEENIMRAERAVNGISRDYLKFARKMAEMKNSMDRAQELYDARQKSLADGHAEGLAEGLAEGRQKGHTEEKLEIARKLKDRGQSLAEIAEITGLSAETIEKL